MEHIDIESRNLINDLKTYLLDALKENKEKLSKSDSGLLTLLKKDLEQFKIGSKVLINNKLFIICKPNTNCTVLLIDLERGITHSERKVDNENNYITYSQLEFLTGTDKFRILDNIQTVISDYIDDNISYHHKIKI